MRSSLTALLHQKAVLLADGASGTNFMEMGLEPGFPPDLWNLSVPAKPRTLHQQFIDAGVDIILTNTFGANAPRLKLHKAEAQAYDINKAGAQIAGDLARKASRPVCVAGSVGPTGELFAPLGSMTDDSAREAFTTQIRGLKDGGADVIWIETMSAAEEIIAAATCAITLEMPYVITASFDTAGKTMMGIAPNALSQTLQGLGVPPLAYGANCGVGASDLLISVMAMADVAPHDIIIAKANCGIPTIRGKQTVYTGTPEHMGQYVKVAVDCGVRIIGGCCGTQPAHIATMRAALDSHKRGGKPQLEDIEQRVGPVSSYGTPSIRPRPRKRRRGWVDPPLN